MPNLIDGNKIAADIIAELTLEVSALPAHDRPAVAFVRVGEDPASVSYVAKKKKTAEQIGITSHLFLFPETISQAELLAELDKLNANPAIHGILVQAPLPKHMVETVVFNHVHPSKDVDGFSSTNLGRLCQEDPDAFVACTPAGVIELLKRSRVETDGKHVVVVGRSLIVGKPAALLFLQKGLGGNATVTVAHSRTKDLGAVTRQADILVAAIGKPGLITPLMVRDGAVVIDVGINRVPDASKKTGFRLVGDVDFEGVAPKCSHITPVPGGVGPMTVAMLMKNTVKAHKLARRG